MQNLKIFVVDDDLYYLNLFGQYLANLGCSHVTTFENGTDCLLQLEQQPDVIFLDYQMDTLTGYEVLKKIKRHNPNIYVVMISAQDQIKPVVDALKHGAFDYLQKGDNEPQKVKEVLSRIIEVKDILQRSQPSILKKIFQFL
jgi:DNA-binding NtrC family response regulator